MATTDDCNNINISNGKYSDPYDERYNTHWEAKPIRPYRTKDEYLYAMCEDLTEWLNDLYSLKISPENFFESLDNGVLLCRHGNRVRTLALEFRQLNNVINNTEMDFGVGDIKYRETAKSGTFQARDNISNFIHWCRNCLKINSVLMFETDDLVLRKNDRSFILCLLEVARRGGLVGMPVPLLVQFEREIDRELNGETHSEPDSLASTDGSTPSSATATDIEPESPSEADSEGRSMDTSPEPPIAKSSRSRTSIPKRQPFTPKRRQPKNKNEVQEEEDPEEYVQIRLSEEVLKTLDERVRDLVNLCTCPNQFPMIREGEGKYRIGESQTLIFVRILRNHVMVRVGGGWDTLEHYLDKHDPCRCQAHKGGGLSRSRSIPRSDSPYHERIPNRRASYQGGVNINKSLKSDSTSANDSDETESVKSQPSKSTPEKYRPTTLQLPPRGSPRNRRMSPTEGSISSDSQTPSSETSSKFEESFIRRRRLSGQDNKQCRSAPGSPQMGRRSRLVLPKSKPTTATEEFLKRKRREAQIKSSARTRVRSAPSSPTRGKNITSELARYDNPPSELLKRITGSKGGAPKLSRSPSRQSRGGSTANRLTVRGGSRDRSVSPAARGKPVRRASSFNSRDKDITLVISRDSSGRHRLDSNSSCDSVESFKDKTRDQPAKQSKGYSPSKRIINAQKNKRSFSSGRTGFHSRDNSLERNISNNNKTASARSRSLHRDSLSKESAAPKEDFFRSPRKPRSRNNSFCSEPGDLPIRVCRSGRSSPTDSVKSNSSTKSLSRLRPVTPVPSTMKVNTTVVTTIRKDDSMGPPSKIPMPVQHKRLLEQQQEQSVLSDMMTWLKTRSYDHGGDPRNDNHFSLPQSPSGRDSISPTPSAKSDFHHDSGFEDNNQFRVTSPLGSVLSPNTP